MIPFAKALLAFTLPLAAGLFTLAQAFAHRLLTLAPPLAQLLLTLAFVLVVPGRGSGRPRMEPIGTARPAEETGFVTERRQPLPHLIPPAPRARMVARRAAPVVCRRRALRTVRWTTFSLKAVARSTGRAVAE